MCVLSTRETPPLNGRQPKLHGRAAAEDRDGDTLGIAVLHDLLHIMFVARMHDHVGHLTDNALAEFQNLLGGLGRGVFDAAVVVQGHIFLAHDGRKRLDLSGFKRRRSVQNHRGMPLILLL